MRGGIVEERGGEQGFRGAVHKYPALRGRALNEPIVELLQGLEHVNEEVRRLALVLRQVLEAQQRGERLSDATIQAHFDQLTRAQTDQDRMARTIAAF